MNQTIMMIHGMWGGGWYWENFKNYFEAGGYTCLTPTLRYHDTDPKSEPHSNLGTTSILDYAADLEKLIGNTGGKPILIGHSMGGLITQILASRGLASAAVLLAPASPRGIMALQPSVIKSFKSVPLRWAFWKTPMRQTFDEAVYSMLHLLTPEQQKKVYGHFVYESGRAAAEIGFWLLDGKRATEVDEKKVTCPILIIVGTEDRITPAAVVKQVHKKYKNNSTYIELKKHAHWIMGEPGWEEVAKTISDWLKRLP